MLEFLVDRVMSSLSFGTRSRPNPHWKNVEAASTFFQWGVYVLGCRERLE
jgi:hypothetical protein